jgi:hypothetical protein
LAAGFAGVCGGGQPIDNGAVVPRLKFAFISPVDFRAPVGWSKTPPQQ